MVLNRLDLRVTSFHNGEVILTGDYEVPDLFLLDKQLSGVDGLDLCRYIKSQEKTRRTPVIMISASPNISMLAKPAGADAVIIKPYKMSELKTVVLALLDNG